MKFNKHTRNWNSKCSNICRKVGDINRFDSYEQIRRYAGLNLVENSSGNHKGKTTISKRGRSLLRSILYRMAFTMVNQNKEIKELYRYLITRKENQLKKKQAIVAVIGKNIKKLCSVTKNKNKGYESNLTRKIRTTKSSINIFNLAR